jgi:hypothetical protein
MVSIICKRGNICYYNFMFESFKKKHQNIEYTKADLDIAAQELDSATNNMEYYQNAKGSEKSAVKKAEAEYQKKNKKYWEIFFAYGKNLKDKN